MKINRRVTMQDVAQHVNVTRTTVSSVLNGRKNGVRVSEATRLRILQAVEDLNYYPSEAANSLKRQSTDIIGYVHMGADNDNDNFFTAKIIKGLISGAIAEGRDILLLRGTNDAHIRRNALGGRVDGLIAVVSAASPFFPILQRAQLPIVAIADTVQDFPSVVVDEHDGGRQIAEHIATRGFRNVLYRRSFMDLDSSLRRYQGFESAANVLGLSVVETLTGQYLEVTDFERDYLTNSAHYPCVVVGWNDYATLPTYKFCCASGIRIPQDVGIIGFDGDASLLGKTHSLTTMNASWDKVSSKAVSVLMRIIDGGSAPPVTILPTALILGDTT